MGNVCAISTVRGRCRLRASMGRNENGVQLWLDRQLCRERKTKRLTINICRCQTKIALYLNHRMWKPSQIAGSKIMLSSKIPKGQNLRHVLWQVQWKMFELQNVPFYPLFAKLQTKKWTREPLALKIIPFFSWQSLHIDEDVILA